MYETTIDTKFVTQKEWRNDATGVLPWFQGKPKTWPVWLNPKGRPASNEFHHCIYVSFIEASMDDIWYIVIFGDTLLGFVMMMMAALFVCGGTGLVEHPSCPSKESSASIWRTVLLQVFQALDDFEILNVAQGWYGAPSSKPTTLLALRLPTLKERLRAGRVTTQLPKGYSLGRNAQGEFQTARLKEYPPALCRNFASSIRDSMDCVPIDDSNDPTADFLAVCQELEVSLYSKTMGRDFHG